MALTSAPGAAGQTSRHVHFADLGMMLHDAVRDRDLRSMQQLIEQGTWVDFRDDHNNTPLHRAVHSGFVNGVQTLLSYNADPFLLDGHYGLSAKDLCQRNLQVQSEGMFYRRVPAADIVACYELLEAAGGAAELAGALARLRVQEGEQDAAMHAVPLGHGADPRDAAPKRFRICF